MKPTVEEVTVVFVRAGDVGYDAVCLQWGVVSQGETMEEAASNLREALELFLECADVAEIEARYWRADQ